MSLGCSDAMMSIRSVPLSLMRAYVVWRKSTPADHVEPPFVLLLYRQVGTLDSESWCRKKSQMASDSADNWHGFMYV